MNIAMRLLSFGLVLLPLTGDALARSEGAKTITYSDVVSLSHNIDETIPIWPGDPPVEFETVATFPEHGYYLRRFAIGEHSATHMNAPNSFHEGAQGIAAYEPGELVVPAILIDVRDKAEANPDYALTIDRVKAWEAQHGKIPAGSLVILYTGWQSRWNDPEAFFNQDAEGGLHFPGFAGKTTQWLLEERRIAGVGIDTHGVDPGQDTSYATNTQVLAQKGIVLENLTNLDALPPTGTTLVIGILRLKEGSGSPVSVKAFLPPGSG